MKYFRADSSVKMWRFSDVSETNSALIFRVCWWFGRTKTDDLVTYSVLCRFWSSVLVLPNQQHTLKMGTELPKRRKIFTLRRCCLSEKILVNSVAEEASRLILLNWTWIQLSREWNIRFRWEIKNSLNLAEFSSLHGLVNGHKYFRGYCCLQL